MVGSLVRAMWGVIVESNIAMLRMSKTVKRIFRAGKMRKNSVKAIVLSATNVPESILKLHLTWTTVKTAPMRYLSRKIGDR